MIDWIEHPISREHNRDNFDCGDTSLNTYLRRFARQNHEAGVSRAYVTTPRDNHSKIIGYYTISPASLGYERVPESLRRKLPRYDIPVFRLGRLAVDLTVQNRGLGGHLFLAAGQRCIRAAREIGGVAMIIDSRNEHVSNWYQKFGALASLDEPLTLIMKLDLIATSLEERQLP